MNIASDLAIMKDKSQVARYLEQYKNSNPNANTVLAVVGQILYAGGQGALSGLVMGGSGVTINTFNTKTKITPILNTKGPYQTYLDNKENLDSNLGNGIIKIKPYSEYLRQQEAGKSTENIGNVKYYRVQGGTPPNASRYRISIGNNGKISILNKNSNVNISTGGLEHAKYFKNLRGEKAEIFEFELPTWFDDFVKENAIPQKGYTKNPLNQRGTLPKIVDPTTPGHSYEFPSPWTHWIEEYATNGKII